MEPRAIGRIFTSDAAAIEAAVGLLRIAAVFQIYDGIQVACMGALRGAGNTRSPMIWNVVGYWVLGIPAACYLAFYAVWGAEGLWTGLAFGLGVIALFLLHAWWRWTREARR